MIKGKCKKCGEENVELFGKKQYCYECYDEGFLLCTTLDGMIPKVEKRRNE